MNIIVIESVILSISIIAMILNAVWIFSILRKSGAKSMFEITLSSMAIGDLIAALSQLSLRTANIIIDKGKADEEIKSVVFVLADIWDITINSSFLHIVFIAVQRLIATLYPFEFKRIFTRVSCTFALITLWSASILHKIGMEYSTKQTIIWLGLIWVPLEIIVTLIYALICYYMFRKRRQFATPHNDISRQNRALLGLSLAITIAFFISTLPDVLIAFGSISNRDPVGILIHLHIILNPLIYFLFNYLKARGSSCCSTCYRNSRIVHFSMTEVTHTTNQGNRNVTAQTSQ